MFAVATGASAHNSDLSAAQKADFLSAYSRDVLSGSSENLEKMRNSFESNTYPVDSTQKLINESEKTYAQVYGHVSDDNYGAYAGGVTIMATQNQAMRDIADTASELKRQQNRHSSSASSSYDDYEPSYRDSSETSTSYSSNNKQSDYSSYTSQNDKDICDLDPLYRNPRRFDVTVSEAFSNEQKYVAERKIRELVQRELDSKCPEDDWIILTSSIDSYQCEGAVTSEGKVKLESGESLVISNRGPAAAVERGIHPAQYAVIAMDEARVSLRPQSIVNLNEKPESELSGLHPRLTIHYGTYPTFIFGLG